MEASEPEGRGFSSLAALCGALLLLGAHLARAPFHEWWRDEWQTWLTVSASANLAELVSNTRFDGHPTLWPLLVWLAWRAVPQPWVMSTLHAMMAAAWAFVVLRWAPFPRWASVLVVLGYFPFFEYAVINRNYALAGLLACTACALVGPPTRRPLLAGAALGLLAFTSAYGAILALAMLLVLGVEAALGAHSQGPAAVPRGMTVAGLALGAALTAFAIVDGLPAAGSGFATGWRLDPDPHQAMITARGIFRAFVPVPAPGLHFWNSNWLDGQTRIQAVLGAALVGLVWAALRGHRRGRWLWIAGGIGLAGFSYAKLSGSMRHHGFYFLCALCACWLAAANVRYRPLDPTDAQPSWRRRLAASVLALHVAVALYATGMDLRHPFSASAAAAAWLESQGLSRLPIVAEKDTRVSPLAGLLEEPLFYVRGRRWGTFVVLDRLQARAPTAEDIRTAVAEFAAQSGGQVLVVLSDPVPAEPPGWRRLAAFGDSIVAEETYVVYLAGEAP